MTVREPVLNPVLIGDLRPTQITIGFRAVEEKKRRWREKAGDKEAEYLGRHMIPVLTGPNGRSYVLDHHHLCRALIEAGQTKVLVNVVLDLSHLARDEFWVFVDNRGWCHPYDADGERQAFSAIPKDVRDLVDDPYRSLAGDLRRAGGFSKDTTPYSEFIWADFLRRRVDRKMVDEDFPTALAKALDLARGAEATHLPGWCGPNSSD
jgi:hypothetical protein